MADDGWRTEPPSTAQCPVRSTKAADQLRHAREDAALLLAHAARSDRSALTDTTKALIDAIETLDDADRAKSPATKEQRSAFWKAYDSVAAAMAPVSAFSIRSTRHLMERKGWNRLRTPTTGLALLAVVVFALSLFAQYMWVTGRELLDQAGELSKQKSQAIDALWKLRDEDERIAAQRSRLSERARPAVAALRSTAAAQRSNAPPTPAGQPAPGAASDAAHVPAKLELLAEAQALNRSAMRPAQRQLDEMMKSIANLEPALSDWYRLCPALLCKRDWLDRHDQDHRDSVGREAALMPVRHAAAADAPGNAKLRAADKHAEPPAPASDPEAREQTRQHAEHTCDLVHRARMLLRALDAYVIPMLMGWLGALAFMLRSLVLELRSLAYTPALASISLIRMVLGMMAGALGGMFVPADESLKALPPMALPFVFGYGVEILFSLLDRIVNAFPATAPAKA